MKKWVYKNYRVARRLFFRHLRLFVWIIYRLWLGKVKNRENLPKEGPVLLVSNHLSYFDWTLLSAVYDRKYLVFLANKDLLNRPFVSWLMNLNIIVFVDKTKSEFSYFKKLVKRLREGHIVAIYPEGTRSRTGKMLKPHIGFMKLISLTGSPVVPIGMKGTYEILPPRSKIPRLKKCDVVVGKKINIDCENPMFKDIFKGNQKLSDLNDRDFQFIVFRIMDKIAKMANQEWEEDVRSDVREALA